MNSPHGGTIVIGIDKGGTIKGINQEYSRANKQRCDWDSYSMWLCQRLDRALDAPAAFSLFEVTKYVEDNCEICAISVRPSPTPVFVNKEFYVRNGAISEPKVGRDLLSYCSRRWKNLDVNH